MHKFRIFYSHSNGTSFFCSAKTATSSGSEVLFNQISKLKKNAFTHRLNVVSEVPIVLTRRCLSVVSEVPTVLTRRCLSVVSEVPTVLNCQGVYLMQI